MSGTTVGASNDHGVTAASAPGCVPESAFGPDRMYRFTLDEPTSVAITLTHPSDFDASLALYAAVACDAPLVAPTTFGGHVGYAVPEADDEIDGKMDAPLCVDVGFFSDKDVLDAELLPAGDYWIVVDGSEGGAGPSSGSYELTLRALPGGLCVDKALELPEGPEARMTLGALRTHDAALELVACAEDVDAMLFGHMGGTLDVDVTVLTEGEALDVQLHEAIMDPAQLKESLASMPGNVVNPQYTRGSVVQSGTDQPPGFYVLTVSGAARQTQYRVDIVHGCTGDRYDLPGEVDDAAAPELVRQLLQRDTMLPDDPPIRHGEAGPLDIEIGRTLCEGDEDLFVIAPEDEAPFSLVLHEAAGLEVTWETVDASGIGASLPATAVETVDGDVRTFRVDAPEPTRVYRARVREQTPSTAARVIPYQVLIDYPVLEPEQRCVQAATLTEGVQASGGLSGTSRYESPCGDGLRMPPSVRADEDFYAFTLDATTSVQVELAAEMDVVLSIVSAPGHVCTTHEDLIPVSRTGEVPSPADASLCTWAFPGSSTWVARDLPPGDYFLIVDGWAGIGWGTIVRPRSYFTSTGSFVVSLTTLDALPEPSACTNAREVDVSALAADVATVTVDVLPDEVTRGSEATLYALPCSQPASFSERVLTFVAPATGTLTAHVASDVHWVRSMALASGACDTRTSPDLDACTIYEDLSAPVVEGERYWLQLDNDVYEAMIEDVRIELSLAP